MDAASGFRIWKSVTILINSKRGSKSGAARRAEWRNWRAAVVPRSQEPEPESSPLQKRVDFFVKCCGLTQSQGYLLGAARADFPQCHVQ